MNEKLLSSNPEKKRSPNLSLSTLTTLLDKSLSTRVVLGPLTPLGPCFFQDLKYDLHSCFADICTNYYTNYYYNYS